MAYSNKWLITTCPTAETFNVDKTKTEYHIQYSQAQNTIAELNDTWDNLKSKITQLESNIKELRNAIDSNDYREKTAALIAALDNSIIALDSNFLSLFRSAINRLNASAASDDWFSQEATAAANYVESSILGGINASSGSTGKSDVGVLGRTAATVGTFGAGFAEGVVNVAEMGVDALAIAGTGIASIFTGIADGVGAAISAFTGSEYKSTTKAMWDATAGFVTKDYSTDWFDSFYDNTSVGQTLKDNSYAFDLTRGAGKLAGEITTMNAGANVLKGLSTGVKVIDGIGAGGTSAAALPTSPLPTLPSAGNMAALPGAVQTSGTTGTVITDILDVSGNIIANSSAVI